MPYPELCTMTSEQFHGIIDTAVYASMVAGIIWGELRFWIRKGVIGI